MQDPYNYAAIYASGFIDTDGWSSADYDMSWQTNNQVLGFGLAVSEDGKTLRELEYSAVAIFSKSSSHFGLLTFNAFSSCERADV